VTILDEPLTALIDFSFLTFTTGSPTILLTSLIKDMLLIDMIYITWHHFIVQLNAIDSSLLTRLVPCQIRLMLTPTKLGNLRW